MIDATSLADYASELLGQPAYVVFASEGVPADLCIPGALAWTGRTLDVMLRSFLDSRWQGRRPAIAFDDVSIREHAEKIVKEFGGNVGDIEREITNAMLVHELAHVAQKGLDTSDVTPKLEKFAAAIATFSIAIQPVIDDVIGIKNGHDATFARLCCHLHYRGSLIGCDCPIHWIYDGENYGIPPIDLCAYALDDEPRCLLNEPIFDIQEFNPRFNFTRLFQRTS